MAFVLAGVSTPVFPAPAHADAGTGGGPCDSLTVYLRDALSGPPPTATGLTLIDPGYDARERRLEEALRSGAPTGALSYVRRVTPACRAEARRDDAPDAAEAIEAARAWTQRSERGWIDRGRIIRCAMQDYLAYNVMSEWMADVRAPEARAVCASALVTWPDAESLRDRIFGNAVRQNHGSWPDWKIDEAIVAAANVLGTPEMRELLVPVLVTARARQALGSDRLRDAVCTDDGMMSSDRARACSTLLPGVEHAWRRSEHPRQGLVRSIETAIYGGAIATAYLTRNDPDSSGIATTAGVVGGAIGGIVLTWVIDNHRQNKDDEDKLGLWMVGMFGGGVLGGVTAHALAAHPAARAPVTGVGFAPIYLLTLGFTSE